MVDVQPGAAVPDFKPSDVVLQPHVPLIGTMGRAEAEAAAGWMILALRDKGDAWGEITPGDCGDVLQKHGSEISWIKNPFLVPDFWDLVERGFAEFVGDEGKGRPVRFTPAGFEAMRKWVRPPAAREEVARG